MNPKIDGFDWDEGNEQKCQKHGLAKRDIKAFSARYMHKNEVRKYEQAFTKNE